MVFSLIGSISLNISFILYLIVYLPQLIHNQKSANIKQLSLNLHLLLFTSYFFDLCYGFAKALPWQYKTVSIVGLTLVCIQHGQLMRFFIKNNQQFLSKFSFACFLIASVGLYYFFIEMHYQLSVSMTSIVGVIARVTGLMYCLPQIIRNNKLKSAQALSIPFLYMNLSLALLDTVSSWCLDWGWPNKVASPISSCLMIILLWQNRKYKHFQKSQLQNQAL